MNTLLLRIIGGGVEAATRLDTPRDRVPAAAGQIEQIILDLARLKMVLPRTERIDDEQFGSVRKSDVVIVPRGSTCSSSGPFEKPLRCTIDHC